jgi:VIT1/CCC1 family predicted Fe2+/Mn2+ transporter
VNTVVQAITSTRTRWVDFTMKFELGIEQSDPGRAARSAPIIAISYIVGGMIPLAPYICVGSIRHALLLSVVVTAIALGVFGYVKGRFTVKKPWRSAWQTVARGRNRDILSAELTERWSCRHGPN